MARHQLADVAEQRAIFANITEGQQLGEQLFFECSRNRRMFQQSLDFRGEGEQLYCPNSNRAA